MCSESRHLVAPRTIFMAPAWCESDHDLPWVDEDKVFCKNPCITRTLNKTNKRDLHPRHLRGYNVVFTGPKGQESKTISRQSSANKQEEQTIKAGSEARYGNAWPAKNGQGSVRPLKEAKPCEDSHPPTSEENKPSNRIARPHTGTLGQPRTGKARSAP